MSTFRSVRFCLEQLEERELLSAYFVSPTGSDQANGSSASPWLTLQRAADVVQAGDTVTVRAGNYAGFQMSTDGTANARIVFQAETGVTINTPVPVRNVGINLEGADYVTIDGFRVVGMSQAGIRSVINHDVIIRNNVCDQNGNWGIFTGFSDDLLIENNVTSRSANQHGIYVSNSGDRPIIRNNTSWGNRACGIHMNGDASQGGDGIISNALVEGNIIYDNGLGGGSAINCDGVQNSIFRNNLLYNNHASGISFFQFDGGDSAKNNILVNNTFLNASDARWVVNIQNGSTGNRLYNNIFYSNHSFRGIVDISSDSLTGFVSNYNTVMNRFTTNGGSSVLTLAQWQAQTGQDMNSIVATPSQLFVDPATNDYHLISGSPAIDVGTSTNAPGGDLAGNSRPSGSGYDIGAYEYQSVSGPTVSNVTSSTANGSYSVGTTVQINVTFSGNVTVTGTPQLALNSGGTANYTSGSGSSTLTFSYTVAAGHNSADLDYTSTSALTLNGGTIRDAANNNAALTLASPGASGSLGANKAIVIDTVAPTVSNVTSSTANGSYGIGSVISISVVFNSSVTVTGTPQLALNSGGTANYTSGSGTSTLTFSYTVVAGQNSADLDYTSTSALTLNGGTIRDAASNNAVLTLASPGASGSLGANNAIVINTIPVNQAPTLPSISNQTVAHGTTSTSIGLNAADANGDSLTATVTLRDPLFNLKSQYGLTNADQYFNYRGAGEKYFFSTNNSNPNGANAYVLMPTNKLYAWNGSLSSTLGQAPVADFTTGIYGNVDVYSHTALLYSNTGVPIVSVDNPLYDLKAKYGLDTAAMAFNARGGNEYYLHSSNGSNREMGGWYLLLPNNTLVAWNGSLSNYSLVADLAPYGNVYGNPALLTNASKGTAVGVTASITSPITSFPGGSVTITPTAGWQRTVIVTVSVSDGMALPVSSSFNYQVTNAAPTIAAVPDQSIPHNQQSLNVPVTVSDTGDASSRVYSVSVSANGSSDALADLAGRLGLFDADKYFNYRGSNEKYLISSNGASNIGNGAAYLLMPDNKLYAWDGNSITTTTAGSANSPYFVADFSTAQYGNVNVYATPTLLYNALKAPVPVVNVNQGPLYDVRMKYGLNSPDIASAFNYRGQSEKYLQSSNGSNAAGAGYYVLLPNGELRAWDNVSIASSPVVANLSHTDAYSDPSLLYRAQAVFVNDAAYDAKWRFGLNTTDLYFNYRGQNERYFQSSNGSNSANGGWYVLMSNGDLRAWDGSALNTSPVVASLGAIVAANPSRLYSSTGQAPAVTATIDSNGLVTLSRNAAFTGSVRVTVSASDGAGKAAQSFAFTVTNAAPTLPAVANITGSSNSGGVSAINLGASDADGDAIQYGATTANNPLYLLKTQYGLGSADFTQYFNFRGQNEKYFVSSNGSNAANGGWYVLASNNRLYAWNGVSYASTVAQAPVADFTSALYGNVNVYGNTSLLYNAMPTAGLTNIAWSFSAGQLSITWPTNFTGSFLMTVYVSDGAEETQRTLLVTVS